MIFTVTSITSRWDCRKVVVESDFFAAIPIVGLVATALFTGVWEHGLSFTCDEERGNVE
jgi:hypothetical protein